MELKGEGALPIEIYVNNCSDLSSPLSFCK